jgi:hypothetical protein
MHAGHEPAQRELTFVSRKAECSYSKERSKKTLGICSPHPLPGKALTRVIFPAGDRPSSLHVSKHSARSKSLFASFSSEKEDLFFFEKTNQKTFTSGAS